MVAHSNGMCALAFGKPDAASVMQAIPLVVWFRPVSRHDRVGEHSAVVWKFVYRMPRCAIRLMFGVSIRPAERLHRREPDVVEHDVQDARRALRRHRLAVRLPIGNGVLDVDVDDAPERCCHRMLLKVEAAESPRSRARPVRCQSTSRPAAGHHPERVNRLPHHGAAPSAVAAPRRSLSRWAADRAVRGARLRPSTAGRRGCGCP